MFSLQNVLATVCRCKPHNVRALLLAVRVLRPKHAAALNVFLTTVAVLMVLLLEAWN